MIDLHSHVLPGLDDGATDVSDAIELARAMAADGTSTVCGTPHVRDDYPTSPAAMSASLQRVRTAINEAGIAIDVRGGGEIALDQLARLETDTLRQFGLGGNPNLLLLEAPYANWPLDLGRICGRLRHDGIVPVLAHPERNTAIQEHPLALEEFVRAGGFVQLTAASVDGRLGKAAAACAQTLLELELAHVIASDAHGVGVREAGLSSAVRAVGGGDLGRWLTYDVPASLLAGEVLPPRPSASRRGLLRRLRP